MKKKIVFLASFFKPLIKGKHLSFSLVLLYSYHDFISRDENTTDDATANATVNPTQRKILEEIERMSAITYEQLAERLKRERTAGILMKNCKLFIKNGIIYFN